MNIAGGNVVRCVMHHLSSRDTFAWSQGCPFMTGTTGLSVSEQSRMFKTKAFVESIFIVNDRHDSVTGHPFLAIYPWLCTEGSISYGPI